MNESDTEVMGQELSAPAGQAEVAHSVPSPVLRSEMPAVTVGELAADEPAAEAPDMDAAFSASQATVSPVAELVPPDGAPVSPEPDSAALVSPEVAAESGPGDAAKRREDLEAYWKTALTGNPDSIPESFRSRAASADVTSSAEETEYDLLSAVNRSWYADHSELSKERILAEWPRIRTELADRYGVESDERELFTALSIAPEEEARREAASKAYEEAYRAALLGEEPEKRAPWTEEADPWADLEKEAAEKGAEERRLLLPSAQTLSTLFSMHYAMENSLPMEAYLCMWDTPEMESLGYRLAVMPPEMRRRLYEVTLSEMERQGRKPTMSDSLYAKFRQSFFRGGMNFDAGLAQFSGNLTAAATNAIARMTGWEGGKQAAESMDSILRVMEELRVVAQERVNPLHAENESLTDAVVVDVGESLPAAMVSMAGPVGLALAAPSGIGMGLAEVRERAAHGDISLQTAAGVLAFGAQTFISELFARGGGKLFERGLSSFVSKRVAEASGGFTLQALRAGGVVGKEATRNIVDNRIGRVTDLLAQEGAARLEGVASNIDWQEYGKEFGDVELGIREAARTLPYVLIGSGRASLHHFRDPHAIVADGAALTQWGVPEEVQRGLMAERDPRKQNRMLYDALHNGSRWGGVGFLEDAARSLRLLHTDDFQPFHDKDVVRDFLQLPAETEAERARVLTLGNPSDPAYVKELARKHAGGSELSDPKKAMPFLLMTEAWTQRAYPEDLTGYPTLKELAPPELTKNGDYSPATEKARAEAVEKTVRYLDALTYRLLLNSTSYGTLTFSGRKPAEVGAEMDALRHKLVGKVAESVLARAGGASPEAADQIFGQFITDYYGKMRFASSADSWIRFAPPKYMAALHTRALSERAMRRGAELRQTRYPEMLKSFWVVQGMHNCMESLVHLLPNQADFRTALSRGMTPQEAYAHLLHRELGSRLPEADWFPGQMAEDVTDRAAFQEKNREMVALYSRVTGLEPESREGDDGRTYWRIMKPDKHYTRWHDSLENCINDMAADCRVRFLPLGGDMHEQMGAAHDAQGRYDAATLGMRAPWEYSYYDRLSAAATGDMIRFWQEDATRAVPGASVESFRYKTGSTETELHPWMRDHPDFPGAWQIDARGVRTPLGLLRGRFDAYWRNNLSSGWLSAEDAADFLMRRGVIDETRRQEIFKRGRRHINAVRGAVTPQRFFSDRWRNLPEPYYDTAGMQGLLARHLADYTTGYFLSHMSEMPMPDSAREWFGLTPFRLDYSLFHEDGNRIQFGKNNAVQSEKWAHQRIAQLMGAEMDNADRVRAGETGEHPLAEDPLYPMLMQAIQPSPARSAEQGWAYTLGGAHALMRVRPESWNLLQEPVRAWSLMDNTARQRLFRQLRSGESVPEGGEVPVPKALEELDAVLKQYPELHQYEFFPGDESRFVRMEVPTKRVTGYRRFDSVFDRPSHEGDNIVHGGFRLQESAALPEFFRSDERVLPALRTMVKLRRAVHDFPYADGQGVWWNGERYGGKDGKKLVGMDDSWYTVEPMAQIRRIFSEMPEDGASVMDFDHGVSFSRREKIPDHAFLSTTVYRSPNYPLTQVRLMPGEREAVFPYSRNPYVTHSFIGAPMYEGQIIRNDGEHNFFLTPLEDFHGDVTREMIGHMAGWWGKQSVKSALEELMDRTESHEALELSHGFQLTNREVLMQLTEDSRFSASLEGRSPQELNAEEALAATWFHALAEYETGTNTERAAADLLRFHEYFTEHPERLEAVEAMLNDHRVWYELDPNDKWYHVVTGSHEIRRANQVKRELEQMEWKKKLHDYMQLENEWDRKDLHNRVGKPKTRRKE